MSRIVHTFGPVASPQARVLVLGSMPGVASLAAGEYYAHPRNQFWPIMGALVGAGLELPYRKRIARLRTAGIALWDVVGECERPGSLDADIRRGTVKPNDLAGLLCRCPRIRAIFCNGQTAARLLKPLLPSLRAAAQREFLVETLPSTSPAHAGMAITEKLRRWRRVVAKLG